MTDQRPVALITMATGYVAPALARSLASRGYDLVLQGADDVACVDGVCAVPAPSADVDVVADETVPDEG